MEKDELLESFPRRPAAFLLADKWKGRMNSHVFYSGPGEENGIYKQNAEKAKIGGDMVFISLGQRVNAEGIFSGCLAPLKHCKLITDKR